MTRAMQPQVKTRSTPITILLVDDDVDCRLLIRDIIDTATACADIRDAGNGQEALAYLREVKARSGGPRPDLISLDVEMPGADGHQVLQAVKADPDLADIPVVMLTGLDDDDQRLRAFGAGAAGYVVKPSEPRRFLRDVTSAVCHWVRLRQDAFAQNGPPAGRQEGSSDG